MAGCRMHGFSSRICERGTRSCVVEHLDEFKVGQRVRHRESRWAGPVTAVDADGMVTVKPDHPRPKEVLTKAGFVPTPTTWPGWGPITVNAYELELS